MISLNASLFPEESRKILFLKERIAIDGAESHEA